ncbi:Cytochrome c oxidase assembly protein COX11, mitochondrial [Trachymyrmex septentrionalis]|uniref:Cytochrome c oxidase assembly protein COX11, mitochondrial n=1 Tax=Trachymyrmex septentrionalis TaxID=34720 RepID=A0A151JVP1_9HYME|nr:Cytochrome c oxidase assembly protein COX11, mitochondrial [Trachymyrmex septentrionalis]
MYLNIYRLLSRTCVRQIHTSVSRNLMKDHSDNMFRKKLRSTAFYWSGVGVLVVGLSYSAVPLYRMFCQAYSYGGTLSVGHDASKVSTMTPIRNRKIKIMFNADVASSMQWNFKPQQKEITVIPGETALAFYTATNPTDNQIVGISTYNVLPFEVGQYFNKIQCFCFEEQMLNPHEQVGVLDIDICGPSQPRVLGALGEQVHQSGSGWSPVYIEDNLSLMSIGFLLSSPSDAVIWRGPKKNDLIDNSAEIFPALSGGARTMSNELNVEFLGSIPLDPLLARCCDEGKNFLTEMPDSPTVNVLNEICKSIIRKCEEKENCPNNSQ